MVGFGSVWLDFGVLYGFGGIVGDLWVIGCLWLFCIDFGGVDLVGDYCLVVGIYWNFGKFVVIGGWVWSVCVDFGDCWWSCVIVW